MESLGLTAVVTGLPPLRGCTVQVPEHTDINRLRETIGQSMTPTTTRSAGTREAPLV